MGPADKEQLQAAVAEVFVLARHCAALVVTPGSTFGGLAAVLSGRAPWFVQVEDGPGQWACVRMDWGKVPSRYGLGDAAALR